MLKQNDKHFGFRVTEDKWIDEANSHAYILEHIQSGAKLLYLKNNDDNKVFSAAFATPPTDHTGVPHIVEHCVLSGSRKYHTKEPFMDMVKCSLNTFINAMTYSDKTVYPVASKNERDFLNLMDVYLDAVFFPKIYEKEETFMQEGWRYDIHKKEDKISYKGVVYNEMKGAYSDPGALFSSYIDQELFKESCYAWDSGGNPDDIPKLSFESFLNFHKTYYHPSNCFLFLYGDLPILKVLEHMNHDYLSKFEKKDIAIDFGIPVLENPKEKKHFKYPVTQGESHENKDYLALSFLMGELHDPLEILASYLLNGILIHSSASPLRQALLDANFAEDIQSGYSDGKFKTFQIILKNTKKEFAESFEKLFFDTLNQMVVEGIDQNLIQSILTNMEYRLRENSNFPTKGIIFHLNAMSTWLYGDEPFAGIEYNESLAALKEKIKEGYFESFIKKYLLNNSNYLLCEMTPDEEINHKKEAEIQDRLSQYQAGLSSEDLNELIEKNKKLLDKQMNPDSPAALATIPRLSLSDLEKETHAFESKELTLENERLLFNELETNQITYHDFYFDLDHLSFEELPYVTLLCELIGQVSTKKHSYSELSNHIYQITGGIHFDTSALEQFSNPDRMNIKLRVSTKTITENYPAVFALIEELTLETKFNEFKRIKDLLNAMKSRIFSSLISQGDHVCGSRLFAGQTMAAKCDEKLKGLDFYFFIQDLLQSFDEKADELSEKLTSIYEKLFYRENLITSFTGNESDLKKYETHHKKFIHLLATNKPHASSWETSIIPLNEGLKTPSQVQYVGQLMNYFQEGFNYSGQLLVLSRLLSSEYLHDRVRAKGGAYGVNCRFSYNGHFIVTSYRDPQLGETYDVYQQLADFLQKVKLSESDVEQLIIGAIGQIDQAMTPKQRGEATVGNYLIGRTKAMRQKIRDEILSTKASDLKKYVPLFEAFKKNHYKCTLGNSEILSQNAKYFDQLISVKP